MPLYVLIVCAQLCQAISWSGQDNLSAQFQVNSTMPRVDSVHGNYVVLDVLKLSRTLIHPTPQSLKVEQILLHSLQYV